MRPNLRGGMLAVAAVAGVALAGCEANGGAQFGGGDGGGSGFEHCLFPYGPSAHVITFTDCNVNCSVDNPDNLTDSDPATFATINFSSAGSGQAGIKASFDDPNNPDVGGPSYPAGNVAGFVLEFPGVLDVSVLPQFDIVTKLDNIVQEDFQFTGVLGSELLGAAPSSGKFFLGVTTTKEFDAVEFKVVNGLLNLLTTVNLYAACGGGDEATTLTYVLL